MKNREKFAKEILDIACNADAFTVTKSGKIVRCDVVTCPLCKFSNDNNIDTSISCHERLHKWTESEYVEKPTITSKEKMFIDLILSKWLYLVRGTDKYLYVFDALPSKGYDGWCIENISMYDYCYISKKLFGNMFDFIKWEDKEPWSIEDLKKLEVRDE